MKKSILFCLFVICLLVLQGCDERSVDESIKTEETVSVNLITANAVLDDFKGKPSVILFAGTYCGHCQTSVPLFKEKLYDKYNSNINLWVNVIDNGKFDVDIPQGFNKNLDFDVIVGKTCNYIPSWVVLDNNANVLLSSCGGEKSLDEIISKIKSIII